MQKRILLAVTGGIAAYKSCELVRLLKKEGHEVTVALSKAASEFVSAQTFEALSGNPVLTENNGSMAHINATRAADLMLIAPASANTIAKLAHGFADNLITEMASARKCAGYCADWRAFATFPRSLQAQVPTHICAPKPFR